MTKEIFSHVILAGGGGFQFQAISETVNRELSFLNYVFPFMHSAHIPHFYLISSRTAKKDRSSIYLTFSVSYFQQNLGKKYRPNYSMYTYYVVWTEWSNSSKIVVVYIYTYIYINTAFLYLLLLVMDGSVYLSHEILSTPVL